jgi:hypothetical protein
MEVDRLDHPLAAEVPHTERRWRRYAYWLVHGQKGSSTPNAVEIAAAPPTALDDKGRQNQGA